MRRRLADGLNRLRRGWDRFWFEGPPSWDRVTALRVAFFGLLGLDMWFLMAPKAYRVGVAGFYVAQLAPLQDVLPLPRPAAYLFAYLVGGVLAWRIAAGVAGRVAPVVLTLLYGGVYYWSQQDGYQHHHLLAMMLLLACFVPWARDRWDSASEAARAWPLKLLYVQVSIVYLFTAVTKVDSAWLDGWALEQQVSTPWVRDGLAWLAGAAGVGELGPYALIAHVVMIWQFFVCLAFLMPRLRPLACVTGPIFHVLVEVIGLKIRWFSFYMLALYYLLLFPDPWFYAVAARFPRVRAGFVAALRPRAWLPVATAVVAGGLVAVLPYPGAVAIGAGVAVIGLAGGRSWPKALTTVVSAAALFVVTLPGGRAYEFHRLDGGDKKRRGDIAGAITAYERAVAVYPGWGPRREKKLEELYERAMSTAPDPGAGPPARRGGRPGPSAAPTPGRPGGR